MTTELLNLLLAGTREDAPGALSHLPLQSRNLGLEHLLGENRQSAVNPRVDSEDELDEAYADQRTGVEVPLSAHLADRLNDRSELT